MDKDYIKKHLTVRVNNATGVIVSPCDKELLYVFTCKHVLESTKDPVVKYDSQEGQEEHCFEVCNVEMLEDENSDVAIIVIKRKGLDLEHLYPSSDRTKCYHIGFPSCRVEEQDKFQNSRVSYINDFDSDDESGLIEYEYNQAPRNEEMKGMSGGGIFNDKGCLVGIHTQSSIKDSKEMLGKAVMIPISHYLKLIVSKNLPPVYKYDLKQFGAMVKMVFDFTDQSVLFNKVTDFLDDIHPYKNTISKWSPEGIIKILIKNGKIIEGTKLEELNDGYWKAFTLFLVGLISYLGLSEQEGEEVVLKLYENFHYCYSDKEMDIYKVETDLNPAHLIGKNSNAILVVGGLKKTIFTGCYIHPRSKVPDISVAKVIDEHDISIGMGPLMRKTFIINNLIFENAVEKCADEENVSRVTINEYRELLKKVFNISDNAS